MTTSAIPFVDLDAQRRRMGDRVEKAMSRVLAHGQFIMGPEIGEFESRLAHRAGTRHAITCSSGTDALALVLMALGVGRGDAVICPAFTFCATAEVVAWVGATPVFVDSEADTFNIAPTAVNEAVETARTHGLRPVGVIPVDLFGLPADHQALAAEADRHGLWVLVDAAQSFGAERDGVRAGANGVATATSFFPAKPLGCYGDGGAVLTSDDRLAAVMRSLRVHGQGSHKYDNVRIGLAARLDTLQAAVLLEKLAIFDEEIERRNAVAARYTAGLSNACITPRIPDGARSVWAQYTIRVEAGRRQRIADVLKADGIPTHVYYPIPLHRQQAYRQFPIAGASLPVAERLAGEVLSLPMHPYLAPDVQDRIIAAARRALGAA